MTSAARFRQSDITRAIKGAQAAGVRNCKIEIAPSGNIAILVGEDIDPSTPNEWDEVLGK